jgi:hypothetical protein
LMWVFSSGFDYRGGGSCLVLRMTGEWEGAESEEERLSVWEWFECDRFYLDFSSFFSEGGSLS